MKDSVNPVHLEREAALGSSCTSLCSPVSLLGAGIQAGASSVLLSQTCLPGDHQQRFLVAVRSERSWSWPDAESNPHCCEKALASSSAGAPEHPRGCHIVL